MVMPVEWYDDELTILKVTITCTSTWDEYHEVVDWMIAEAKKVTHQVDIIFHDDIGLPPGNPLQHLKFGSKKIIALPNLGCVYIAGSQGTSGTFMQMIMSVLVQVYMKTCKPPMADIPLMFVPTLEKALEYIQKDREEASSTS